MEHTKLILMGSCRDGSWCAAKYYFWTDKNNKTLEEIIQEYRKDNPMAIHVCVVLSLILTSLGS